VISATASGDPAGEAIPAGRQSGPRDAAIVARGLTKRYGSVQALDGLDIDVPAGSIFGLLGPNGAGKTTTLRILTGLAAASSGTATVAGIPVGLDRPELHRRTGYLDQDPRFYSWMRGRELLELAAGLSGVDRSDIPARVAAILGRTGRFVRI